MPEEVLALNDEEQAWLQSIARMYGLTDQEAAQTGLSAAIEEQRKPDDAEAGE